MNILKTFLIGAFAVSACLAQGSTESTTVTDADENVYKTVKIGNQVWTVENLRTTKYNDGTQIPIVKDVAAWKALKTPGYCYYNNTTNAESIKKFGALYNWHVVNTGKLAPKGWHVPSDSEWTILEKYLILNGYNWDGARDIAKNNQIAKSLAAKTDWGNCKSAGTIGSDLTKFNSTGFSALPGGYRFNNGSFFLQCSYGGWWGATEDDASNAWSRTILFGNEGLLRSSSYKSCGFSVRLVRDN